MIFIRKYKMKVLLFIGIAFSSFSHVFGQCSDYQSSMSEVYSSANDAYKYAKKAYSSYNLEDAQHYARKAMKVAEDLRIEADNGQSECY